ncbi:MAG: galactose-1-phosphate uridylyltransferase [Gemmatales bacterium]|nr:galactose-1-phosphate uridylyltransferase [Gemmatales bacterium]MDW7994903.1 galactose-1-phosphate uridylyltransferase [Gemmatales bacterium]
MPFLRYDVTTGDWVIFAPERARRPHEFRHAPAPAETPSERGPCPFCPGNEWMTGPEIFALRSAGGPDSSGWRIRVVPNKFPALRVEEENRHVEEGRLFRRLGGCGAHEVIIESPQHDTFLGHHPVEHIEQLLRVLQLRHNDLLRDLRIQQIVLFKNHGERAGTSLRHPHWQLIATPVVPRLLRLKHQIATDYFDQTGHCLYCDLAHEELEAGVRVVASNDRFVAFVPYAAHVPFETWILPRYHQSSFGQAQPSELYDLAQLLRLVLLKMYNALDNPHFNLTINTVPRGDENKPYFLWHIQIIPRLTTPAGFELGSGMSINLMLPEEAASYLRSIRG